jgi:penicillin amidase
MPVRAEDYRGWNSYLTPPEYPMRIDPPGGRLWSANNRQLAGGEEAKIGDAGADVGARATQIRDDLFARGTSDEHDLLAIQTDDRALWIEPWRRLALAALDDAALAGHPARAQFRHIVSTWNGRADAGEAGYELVRAFYGSLYDAWFGRLDDALAEVEPGLSYHYANSRTLAVMDTLASRHAWIPPGFASWDAFVIDCIDRTIATLTRDGAPLERARWGERNRAAIMHPFARMIPTTIPVLHALLAAPRDALPGDFNMPRVQGPSFGASERLVVAPGHEENGIFNMPGGQSGNPVSPYFLAGHDAWVRGDATPFLPGAVQHRMQLRP